MVFEIIGYGFMQKAFLTGIVIAIACSLLGVFLVLRRYALMGDGIAHISFGGIATGLLFNIMPFFGALIFGVIGSLGILKLREKARLYGDAAIGMVSHAGLGIGVFIASIAGGFNVDILSYLFGSILSIRSEEVLLSVFLSACVIGVIALFYRELVYLTFDEDSARTSGVKVDALNTALIALTAVTVVSSMRVVGLLLASALIIMPATSALQLKLSFRNTLISSAAIAVLSVVLGLVAAYYFDFAVSGTIVLVNLSIFLAIILLRRVFSR
ncbi:MAG: metal ABC transporter permease [Candidatus Aenigmarchaeota archaeon]|nr:metal ABC transporter permease [Candidatus Aenigmarchaeota archaeon]